MAQATKRARKFRLVILAPLIFLGVPILVL